MYLKSCEWNKKTYQQQRIENEENRAQFQAHGTPTFGENQESKVFQKSRGEACFRKGVANQVECWKEVQLNEG